MNQTLTRLAALPFAVALFDDGDGSGENGGNQNDGSGQNNNGAAGVNRNASGQFARGADAGNRARDLPQDLAEAHRIISDQDRRIGELNDENGKRRRENRELKTSLDGVQSRQSLVDKRAIRAEAREALRNSGVIDGDVVDLFLAHAGAGIKIDEQTGDVTGVSDALTKFKEAKPVFFKPADGQTGGQGDGQNAGQNGAANGQNGVATGANGANGAGQGTGQNNGQGSGQGSADNRGNATATGASVNGGGTANGEGGFKVANFRDKNVNADEAFDRYKRSLR